ncbi:hypothetical protein PHMEG_00016489 [Phytophthora megakarya]|uniref:Uncharacterized protein n=1 Tax=Phytophthora megakarya TaxID=4795 RepID=A0A225VYP2_9STRA|nr:hypothetical protein PHMEG_00016489 [Phytophthora megakarya]
MSNVQGSRNSNTSKEKKVMKSSLRQRLRVPGLPAETLAAETGSPQNKAEEDTEVTEEMEVTEAQEENMEDVEPVAPPYSDDFEMSTVLVTLLELFLTALAARPISYSETRRSTENAEAERVLATLPGLTEIEMLAYESSQLERWAKLSPLFMCPVDVAYNYQHNGYDLGCYIRAAGTTAKYMLSITRAPSGQWLSEFQAERRQIPNIVQFAAPNRMRNVVANNALGAGYPFVNIVPTRNRWPNLSGIPGIWVRDENHKLGHFIGVELVAWNTVVNGTMYFVRQASDPVYSSQGATTESGLTVDSDGDTIMDQETRVYLGQEVVMGLLLTGTRPKKPSIECRRRISSETTIANSAHT